MLKIEAEKRKEIGKSAIKKLLKEDWVPGIVYGHNEESIPLKIRYLVLKELILNLPSESSTIELSVQDKKFFTIIKELRRDYRTHKFHHIDFQILHKGEKVHIKVPIELKGESIGVKEGGIIDFVVRDIEVSCLPKDIPDKILLDISHLKIGHSLHIRDIETGGKFKINLPLDTPIVSIVLPKKLEAVTPTLEAAAVEEVKEPEVISKKKEKEEEVETEEKKKTEEKKIEKK